MYLNDEKSMEEDKLTKVVHNSTTVIASSQEDTINKM